LNLDAKTQKVIRLAEKALGTRRKGIKLPPLEMAIYAVLAPHNPDEKIRKAMKAMRKSFVDWNEVRVSSWKEIGRVIESKGIVDAGSKAFTLKALLNGIFNRNNKMTLDNLLPEKTEDARRKLEGLEDFPPWATGAVLSLNLGYEGLYVTHGFLRIARRIGLVRESSLSRAKKNLTRRVPRRDQFRLQQHLSYLAETLCLPEITQCEQCPLNTLCDTGIAKIAKALASASRKKAKQAKKAKPAPRKKSKAKKKTPKKKPAKKPKKKGKKKSPAPAKRRSKKKTAKKSKAKTRRKK
jgi:endonuclease III